MNENGQEFGVRLRVCRTSAGLSQEELAERSGLSARAISNLERGRARQPYRTTLQRLADALGLRDTARTEFISAADRRLAPGPDVSPANADDGLRPPVNGEPAPRQLPTRVRAFTGRDSELAALTGLLPPSRGAGSWDTMICVITGAAGAGKTALAVHWAHQYAGRFPDGQLYVNMRGYDPGQPMPATDALAAFLRALGVRGPDIPSEVHERAARYRSLLAGKRMLVILDNAGSAEQVRPLLPGTPSCAVVVTSRDALAGLVARDGATRLDLEVLPPTDAIALLRALIGARVDDELGAAAELADQCCRLPLALRVAAELAAARPATSLASLAGELADICTRLDLLTAGGDPGTDVRAVFSWSYRDLAADSARAFRLLGLHPGPDLEQYAAAALTGTTATRARQMLDVLTRAHLVQQAAPGRYAMHDLLRGYARELSVTHDTGQDQHDALTRVFDHYLYTAATAMDTLVPAERHHRPRIPDPAGPVPSLPDPAAARDWLDSERTALVAAAGHAAAHGWPGHATRLAATLADYLHKGGHLPEALTIFGHALGAARRTSDRAAEAVAFYQIGIVDWEQGRHQQAANHHRRALALYREAGDRIGVAHALGRIGHDEMELGHYEQATRHHKEALALWCDLGDRLGQTRILGLLGLVRRLQGRYQEAGGYHLQSLDLCRQIGDREGEALALARLGAVDLRLGRHQHAGGYLRQAIAAFRDMGHPASEAECLIRLGDVERGLCRYGHAARNLERALVIFREIGDPVMQADALNGLGEVHFQMGAPDQARIHHATSLQLVTQTGTAREQARAHSGLARVYQATGDSSQARHHWQQALTRYAAIGAAEATEIRALLADCAE